MYFKTAQRPFSRSKRAVRRKKDIQKIRRQFVGFTKPELHPVKRTMKNIKFFRLAARGLPAVFMRQGTTGASPSVLVRPGCAELSWCCNSGCSSQSSVTRTHRRGGSTCINRTLRMRGRLTDIPADAKSLEGIRQAACSLILTAWATRR